MKKTLFLLFTMSFTLINAQEKSNESKEEITINVVDGTKTPEEIPFAIIEHVPVYPGCDENMGNQALKECMSSQISSIVSKNFNADLANSLNLPAGKIKIIIMFKIDTDGNVVDIQSRAPHSELEQEAIRVIKLLPKMDKPGYLRDDPVVVPYALPIALIVEEPAPLSKKEQRQLKKKNKRN